MVSEILDPANPIALLFWPIAGLVVRSLWIRRRNLRWVRRLATARRDEPLLLHRRRVSMTLDLTRDVWLFKSEVGIRDESLGPKSYPASWSKAMEKEYAASGNLKKARSRRRTKRKAKVPPQPPTRKAPKLTVVRSDTDPDKDSIAA